MWCVCVGYLVYVLWVLLELPLPTSLAETTPHLVPPRLSWYVHTIPPTVNLQASSIFSGLGIIHAHGGFLLHISRFVKPYYIPVHTVHVYATLNILVISFRAQASGPPNYSFSLQHALHPLLLTLLMLQYLSIPFYSSYLIFWVWAAAIAIQKKQLIEFHYL